MNVEQEFKSDLRERERGGRERRTVKRTTLTDMAV